MKEIESSKPISSLSKLIAVSIGHFFNDFYMNLIPPILFLFVQAMGLSLAQQAFISFVILSSGSFAQPIIGYFVDKRGKPWLVILSLTWISFWMSICGIITNYYLLIIILGLAALASALFHPLGSAMAVKLGKRSRGKSLSIFMTIGGLAASVSPMIAIPIVKAYGLKALVFFMIPGLLVSLLMFLTRVQDTDMGQHQTRKKEQRKKLDHYTTKWMTALVFISTNKVLIRSFLITFGVQIMLTKQISVTLAGVILSVYLLSNSFGTILGGYLNDLLGSKKVLIFFNVLAPLCMLMIVFTSGIPMVIGFLIMGLALSGSNTSNIVLAYELLPENLNFATGLILGLSGGLGGLFMLFYGKIADVQGLIPSTTFLLIPLLMVTFITIILPGEKIQIEPKNQSVK